MAKSKVSPIPLEEIKDFEKRLRKEGFLTDRQRLSSLSIEDYGDRKAASGTDRKSSSDATGKELKCKKFKRVPTRVWDEELQKEVTILVKVCVD
jgi:hypothetical protein